MKLLQKTAGSLSGFAQKMADDPKFPLKLFLTALTVRILFTLIHPQIYLISDMLGYNEAAMSLLEDGEFRVKGVISASRPPMYPFFLTVVYFVFGHSLLAVRLMQAVVGAITAVMVFQTGKLMFDRKTAALAGIFYAFYTASWALGDILLTESLFTLLMIISVYFMIRIGESGSPWVIFWAGLFAGAAALTRTAYVPYIPFILTGVVVLRIGSPRVVSRYILMTLVFAMTIFPWMLRNYYTHDSFTMNPKSGADFYMYNHSGIRYIINNYEDTTMLEEEKAWTWSEVEKGRVGAELGMKWIKENPGLFLFKGFRMMMNIWGFDRDYLWWYLAGAFGSDPVWLFALMALLTNFPFLIIAPLAMAGFIISRPLMNRLTVPTLIIVCLHILSFIVYGFARHRFPFATLLIIWAAYAVINWKEIEAVLAKGRKSWRKRAIIFAWAFLLFSWGFEFLLDAGSLFGMRFQYPGF